VLIIATMTLSRLSCVSADVTERAGGPLAQKHRRRSAAV